MQTAQKVESIKRNIDSFSINFVINNDCNYSCKYCPVSLHDGSAPILPVQDYIDFFTRFIENNPLIYTNFKKQDIQLSGGEPTRYEGIEVLCEFFKKNKFRVIMTSNGSAKLEKWDAVLNNVYGFS